MSDYDERRRAANQRYYERTQRTRPGVKTAREKVWRDKNRALVNERAKDYYYANREAVIFRNWLWIQLMKVRAGEIARGREPYDG